MKDVNGTTLELGDKVVFAYSPWDGRIELRQGEVVDMTPKSVIVEANDKWQREIRVMTPSKIIKLAI